MTHVLGMYSKRSELEIRVRMAVLCVRVHANQSFEPRNSDMVSEKVPFQVPVSEIRVGDQSGKLYFFVKRLNFLVIFIRILRSKI